MGGLRSGRIKNQSGLVFLCEGGAGRTGELRAGGALRVCPEDEFELLEGGGEGCRFCTGVRCGGAER